MKALVDELELVSAVSEKQRKRIIRCGVNLTPHVGR
jgi:hypothetical protein